MYWLTGFLGLISALAPFVFRYTDQPAALWTSIILGVVLLATAVLEGVAEDKQNWEYWTAGVAGFAAILAPFALGFYSLYAALWTMMIVGLVTVIAVWARLSQSGGHRYG